MQKAALLSVSDRTGIESLARGLVELGYVLLTTSGTGKFLNGVGVSSVSIEEYTGQKEILDGRVKTLHPKIHAGLLARRDDSQHMRQLEIDGIMPIDVAAVNLYPFVSNINSAASKDPEHMIEFVDVGGPTMIRAAAKNHSAIYPVIDPLDYSSVLEMLASSDANGEAGLKFRRGLAVKVFTQLAYDNLEVARYFAALDCCDANSAKKPIAGFVLQKVQDLRYGENPHQQASYYQAVGAAGSPWTQLQGKELSYNNLLDFEAAMRLLQELSSSDPTAVIVKHLNPCGAASANTLSLALQKAKRCDPRSHFGGIIALNREVDLEAATEIKEDFAEIVIAPEFSAEALSLLAKNKNLRLLKVQLNSTLHEEVRSIVGGFLIQQRDPGVSKVSELSIVTTRRPTCDEQRDLQLAWHLCGHVKSNAIVIVRDGLAIGVGAGQMSRIDSVELAIEKAKKHEHELKGAVAASDAFFPFPDSIETLAAAGITAIVAPSGAKRDDDVIAVCNKLGVSLVFAPDRHFRH